MKNLNRRIIFTNYGIEKIDSIKTTKLYIYRSILHKFGGILFI